MWGSQRRRWPSRPPPSMAACLKDTLSEWTLPRLPGEIFLSRRETYHVSFLDLMTTSEQSFLGILTLKCRRTRYIFDVGIKCGIFSIFRHDTQYLWLNTTSCKENTIFVAHYNISARCAPCLPNVENWKVYDWWVSDNLIGKNLLLSMKVEGENREPRD